MSATLGTDPYKGTRDFYPEDMAVLRYVFDTWTKTAESFGYERYDASILEPSELYRSKTNEEIVNEQTYTFTDRGDREVTLRPEMTPTAARMIAARRRDLSFPVRWYSIPNLFRYERPQRGRLREHWQLNCDMFGETGVAGDVEMLALAHATVQAFGADDSMFEIRINDRALMETWYRKTFGLDDENIKKLTRVVDRRRKMPADEFRALAGEIVKDTDALAAGLDASDPHALSAESTLPLVIQALRELGVANVRFDASIARGFDYYTGVVFEVFDTSPLNNRAMMGGGRYDNLTSLFGGDPVPGIGFGMGDVVMQDFLLSHNLLPATVTVTAPTLAILPTESELNLASLKIAATFRARSISTSVDTSDRKVGKKISVASDRGVRFIVVVGNEEIESGRYTLKELKTGEERSGTQGDLASYLAES